MNSDVVSGYQVKRIGTTRIEGWLKQSWRMVLQAYEFFKRIWPEKGLDALSEFYWQNGNAYIVAEWDNGLYIEKERIRVYKKPWSGWYKVDAYCGEAF